ncbi:ASPIC/UnbV domain-containing protein [Novipirellula herctigrandis]
MLSVDPTDPDALFRLGNLKLYQGDHETGMDLLGNVPVAHPELGLLALGVSADMAMKLEKYDLAEEKYRKILDRVPDAVPAIRQLAWLLNREGRRHAAVPLLQQLCRAGDVRQDELQALLSVPDALYSELPAGGDPENAARHYYPINAISDARWQFGKFQFAAAERTLATYLGRDGQASQDSVEVPADVEAFYGRILAAAQHSEKLVPWLIHANDAVKDQAEYWVAATIVLLEQRRFEEAVHAAGEALLRDPTDYRTYLRMNQALTALGKEQLAAKWMQRYFDVRRTVELSHKLSEAPIPKQETLEELSEILTKLDRELEAIMWKAIAVQRYNDGESPEKTREKITKLNQRRQQLVQTGTGFPTAEQRLCDMKLANFQSPTWREPTENQYTQKPAITISLAPKFANIADSVGLKHAFRVAAQPQPDRFSIYQQMGGGVAVIDYDLDGQFDLYFAQGNCDPPEFKSTVSNLLYRQQSGLLVDVTAVAEASDFGYTLGVTSGDWNQDGFADLAFANLHGTRLLINNGDGTFAESPIPMPRLSDGMLTSLAIADVTGDAIPELVQAVYADDPNLARKPLKDGGGQIEQLSPLSYKPSPNFVVRQGISDAKGASILTTTPSAASLGLVVANLDDSIGTEVFVANDVYPDHLLNFDTSGNATDSALLRGCALGGRGSRTGSMGIALDDFNLNGFADLHVTNFEDESNSLFLNQGSLFVERSVAFGIDQASEPLVGFGTQSLDYDNNRTRDFVIVNGRVERPNGTKKSFEQPAQIFANEGNRLIAKTNNDPSNYFGQAHLGRALAKLDFNRDGRSDLVVTHLETPSALLINQTKSVGNWCRFRLVGVQCERDAIGATIEISVQGNQYRQWVATGDGYMCRNENVITFGLGSVNNIDTVSIYWPDGSSQIFSNPPINADLLVLQNERGLFELP